MFAQVSALMSAHISAQVSTQFSAQVSAQAISKADHGRPKHSDIRGAASISDAFYLWMNTKQRQYRCASTTLTSFELPQFFVLVQDGGTTYQ